MTKMDELMAAAEQVLQAGRELATIVESDIQGCALCHGDGVVTRAVFAGPDGEYEKLPRPVDCPDCSGEQDAINRWARAVVPFLDALKAVQP